MDRIVSTIRLRDGARIQLRPLGPDDGERLERLFHRLSSTSVYRRFRSAAAWAGR